MATPSAPVDARQLAWDVLIAVEGGGFADAELGRRLPRLEPRDHALATRLVYGTLAWQGYLDYVLARLGRAPERLDIPVRTVLRLGIFQLAKLTRVPDFAAVSTAVELSKRFRRGAASGMVNALLRRFLRDPPPLPSPRDDPPGYLAVAFSHPRWLVDRWLAELGRVETEALLAANNEPAPTVLRANPLHGGRADLLRRLAGAGVAARPAVYAPEGVVLETGGDPTALPGFADGLFTVQGEASQLVTLLLGARSDDRILDACAAPGGKATHLAEQLRDQGRVVAVDLNGRGLADLRRMARRLGLTCIETVQADAGAPPAADEPPFDAVLLDAPCSGFGTLRQHPEIRWRRTPQDLASLSAVQARLLEAVAQRLRPGGALVYATCTIMAVENEQLVGRFLAGHPDFTLVDPTPWLPAAAQQLVDRSGFFRTSPHGEGLDGFFAARLKRCR